MQNWDHVQVSAMCPYIHRNRVDDYSKLSSKFIMSELNKIPRESHDADFLRIKPWYLDGQ